MKITFKNAFEINGNVVILERQKSDINGNAMWLATVISKADNGRLYVRSFKFRGHCQTEEEEAKWALERLEKEGK